MNMAWACRCLLVSWLQTEAAMNSVLERTGEDRRGQERTGADGVPVSDLLMFWRPVCHCCSRLTGCPAHRRWTPGRARWNRELWTWCVICTNQTRGSDSTPNYSFSKWTSVWVNFSPTSHRETLQLSVGPLLHMLLSNIEEKVRGTSPEPTRLDHWDDGAVVSSRSDIQTVSHRKLFLYSAHDTTLMPCLMALGIFDMRWPPYAADLTLELYQHRHTNKAFVKVSYNGQVRRRLGSFFFFLIIFYFLTPLTCFWSVQDQLIPGCSGLYCPLEEFKEAVSAYSLSSELHQSLCDDTQGLTGPWPHAHLQPSGRWYHNRTSTDS